MNLTSTKFSISSLQKTILQKEKISQKIEENICNTYLLSDLYLEYRNIFIIQ